MVRIDDRCDPLYDAFDEKHLLLTRVQIFSKVSPRGSFRSLLIAFRQASSDACQDWMRDIELGNVPIVDGLGMSLVAYRQKDL